MLSKDASLPLYVQLKTTIERNINDGAWKAGTSIPSERALCQRYGISRITVRQALTELVTDGRLERVQGKGTFVASRRIAQQLSALTGFTQDMGARALRPGGRVLEFVSADAPPIACRAFGLPDGAQVIVLKRLRTSDGEPLAVETAYLDADACAGVLGVSMNNASLYTTLALHCGISPTRAMQQMQACACPPAEARWLGIRRGAPVLRIVRTTHDQHDRPFEVVESIYRGDKYVFHAELNGGNAARANGASRAAHSGYAAEPARATARNGRRKPIHR